MHPNLENIAYALKNKSTTSEGALFENFISDYFKHGSTEAFELLQRNGASEKTCELASSFVAQAIDLSIEKIDRQFDLASKGFTGNKAKCVQEFYRDYVSSKNHASAMESAWHRISRDPELQSDEHFIEEFKQLSSKIKPKELKKYDLSIEPDDGLIFQVGIRETGTSSRPLKPEQTKKLLSTYMCQAYGAGVSPSDITHEVDTMVRSGQFSLASQLAYKDMAEKTRLMSRIARDLDKNKDTINMNKIHVDLDKLTTVETSAISSIVNAKVYSASERVDVIRDFITEVSSNISIGTAYKKAVDKVSQFEDIEKYKSLTPEEKKESKTLMAVLDKHYDKLVFGNASRSAYREMLLDAYGCYTPFNRSRHIKEVTKEVYHLQAGIKSGIVKSAILEFNSKTVEQKKAIEMNVILQKSINDYYRSQKGLSKTLDKFGVSKQTVKSQPNYVVEKQQDQKNQFGQGFFNN